MGGICFDLKFAKGNFVRSGLRCDWPEAEDPGKVSFPRVEHLNSRLSQSGIR